MIDVGSMHHGIDGERNFQPHHFGGERGLARVRALIARDAVGGGWLTVLDRDLHMIETGVGELAERFRRDADCRSDEIGIEPRVLRGLGDRHKIAPRARLAAGEVHL